MMVGTLLELLELGGPEAVTEQLNQFPSGRRKEFVRTVLASGFPVPEKVEEFPHPGRRPDPARPAPAAHRRPRHPDPAHPPEAATPTLIHAPRMNQW